MKKLLLLCTTLLVLVGCSQSNIMKDYKGLKTKDHHFVAIDAETLMTRLENKEEGIYYLGYSDCPYCQTLVPEMETAISELDASYTSEGVDNKPKILYLDIRGNGYPTIVDRFEKWQSTLPEANRSNNYVPYVISYNANGDIKSHLGTVDGHTPPEPLKETQEKFLQIRLKQIMDGIHSNLN